MNSLKFILINILFFSGLSNSGANEKIIYIGSYTFNRFTTEHAYVSEVWLWEHRGKFIGLYFNGSQLQGDPFSFTANNIITSSGNIGHEFSFKTQHYTFKGVLSSSQMSGLLKQGNEVIRGGVEDSFEITLLKGSNIKKIQNPENTYKTFQPWVQWVETLENLH